MGFNTDDYVTVPERISEFYARYPEGSLQQVGVELVQADGKTYLLYTAAAFRTPDDPRPAHGTAWEQVPGPTNFTRGSEAQNAETSAVGRAISLLGIGAKRSVASAEDIIKAREQEQAREQLSALRKEIVSLAKAWAEEVEQDFENANDCVLAFLDARGLKRPQKDAPLEEIAALVAAARGENE